MLKISDAIYPLTQFSQTGHVHSVFENSFNIQLENQLINIGCYEDYLSSYGLTISPQQFAKIRLGLEVDNFVKIQTEKIRIYQREKIITISLKERELVNLTILNMTLQSKQQYHLEKLLSPYFFKDKIGLDLTMEAMEIVDLLKRPTNYFTQTEVETIVHYLVGRGQGLTPSGDDILMGYFSIVQLVAHEKAEVLASALSRPERLSTTDISQAYYKSTLAGYSHSYMYQLFEDLITNQSSKKLVEDIKKILSIGHSSGADLLFGVYLALKSCDQYGNGERDGECK